MGGVFGESLGRALVLLDEYYMECNKKITPEIGEYRIISFNHPTQQCRRRKNLHYHQEEQKKFRSNLDNETSLNSIMLIKINKPESFKSCYQWKFSNEQLKKCKTACKEYNSKHSTS